MHSLAFWRSIEYVSIAIVTAGVIGEYISDFILRDERHKVRFGKISTLVLIAGLALELPAIWLTEEQIARLNLSAARAQKEAESARAAAKGFEREIIGANERIAEAVSRERLAEAAIVEAGRQTEIAKRGAARAAERAALANEKAETLKTEAEALKAESFALQRILRPRRLYNNPEWVEPLKPFQGTQALIFVFPDSEAQVFAGSIASVLNQAGWTPEIRESVSVSEGLSIWSGTWPKEGSSPDRAWMAGEALADVIGKEFAVTETGPRMSITHGSEDIRPLDWKPFARPPGVVLIEVGMPPMYESLMLLKYMKGVYKEGPPPKRPKVKPKPP